MTDSKKFTVEKVYKKLMPDLINEMRNFIGDNKKNKTDKDIDLWRYCQIYDSLSEEEKLLFCEMLCDIGNGIDENRKSNATSHLFYTHTISLRMLLEIMGRLGELLANPHEARDIRNRYHLLLRRKML